MSELQLEYNRAALATLEMVLTSVFATAQQMSNGLLDHLRHSREGIADLLNPVDPDLESVDGIAQLFGFKFDRQLYHAYLKITGEDQFLEALFKPEADLDHLGLVSGLQTAEVILLDTIKDIEGGKDLDELYTDFSSGSTFVVGNMLDLDYGWTAVRNELHSHGKENLAEEFKDNDFNKTIEREEFIRLFLSGNEQHNWMYIADRLGLTTDQITKVYQERNAVLNGTFVKTYYSTDRDQRFHYAVLLAVRDYIRSIELGGSPSSSSTDIEVDPEYPNLSLMTDYHKNLEAAYKLMKDEFIVCDFSAFEGIFIPGKFRGKVLISDGTNVAEIKLLLIKISGKLRSFQKGAWVRAGNLFDRLDRGQRVNLTSNSFNSAKHNLVPNDREQQIDKIVSVLLSE